MPKYIVTANVLRIRSGPGTTYAIIGALFRNNIVQGDDINGEWIHVTSTDNKVGWSHRGFLELINEAPPVPSAEAYRVDANTLNLRQGPGLNYAAIGTLKKGEVVEGLAVSADHQWAQVRQSSGVTGWASLKYLTKIPVPPPPGPNDVEMIVTTDTLNVRSGPGTGYSITDQVHRGETVIYLNASPAWDWVNIKTKENKTGWCSSKYLMERTELFASPDDYDATGFHRTLSDSLSMREGPGENHPAIVELKFNRVVNVDVVSPDGRWKHCTNAWGESGWYPVERLGKLGDIVIQQQSEEFSYLPVAFAEFGIREIPGNQHNPRILEYIRSTDLARYPSLPDETDWCAAFVNWCVEKVGLPSTNSAVVSPWRNWGIKPAALCRGCVITFRWDDGWDHISFYLGDIGNYVVCLGGNQSDAVWISVYHKKYVTSFRVP
jgi:uncharacterized protein (TIGR02594 family)